MAAQYAIGVTGTCPKLNGIGHEDVCACMRPHCVPTNRDNPMGGSSLSCYMLLCNGTNVKRFSGVGFEASKIAILQALGSSRGKGVPFY